METIDEMLKNDLTDKVILITGGAQRVGARSWCKYRVALS